MPEDELSIGVLGTCFKENERRAPIHPRHFDRIPEPLRKYIYIERGYGKRFHIDDTTLGRIFAGVSSREELFEQCDVILLPKPTEDDFRFFREGQVLWGWPHCVQNAPITQMGIDKKLTYIAWESMFLWKSATVRDLHIFQKNNELAGYCSVLHAMQLCGITGHYGPHKRAAVISFGSTGRGAVYALMGLGIADITVLTQRPSHLLTAPIPAIAYGRYVPASPDSDDTLAMREDGASVAMAEMLADYDIIVNCILQNPNRPRMFIQGVDVERLKPGALIVDVSCDNGMGFDFARPTSFDNPAFTVGDGVTYYAVDHSPTYLWQAASYEISLALLPFLATVLGGRAEWKRNTTISRAIEIDEGEIKNPDILRFQKRSETYPHERLDR